ncbi:hypothetical protein M9458_034094, partial [Cirrhinus mrigala]
KRPSRWKKRHLHQCSRNCGAFSIQSRRIRHRSFNFPAERSCILPSDSLFKDRSRH